MPACLPRALILLTLAFALAPAPVRAGAVRAGDPVPFEAASPHPYPTGFGKEPVWSVEIAHPGATYIAVHFDRFELGPGDRVVVRSAAAGRPYVFTGRGKGDLGAFWATHVPGDRAVVELFSPGQGPGGWGVSIDRYAAGRIDLQTTEGTESICGVSNLQNAICFQPGEPQAYDHSRAVARLLIEGQLLCTGWLVGCQGDLLTNNHCIDDATLSDPATATINTDYEFMAEASACGQTCGPLQCPGTIWGGAATLVKRSVPLDYAFIHLAGDPDSTYGSFLLDNRTANLDERIYIPQHPGGRGKELGLVSTDPSDQSGFCEVYSTDEPACITGGPFDVGYYCDTEGGSSGSPVVAYSSHKVIALHHCSACPNRAVPIGSVIADLGASLPTCALVEGPDLVLDALQIDDSVGNGDGIADPGETLGLVVTLKNAGSADATLISGLLGTSEPMVTIVDGEADWPDLAIEASADSLPPHLMLALDPSIPCGAMLDLTLDVSTAEGPFSIPLSIQVGTNIAPSVVRGSTDTPLAIPDNSAGGIVSSLVVTDAMTIGDLNVAVDITHTWIGDLEMDLVAPGAAATVRLHNRSGGSSQNIQTTYDLLTQPDGPGTMDDFNGLTLTGTWQLRVADRVRRDTGTLNSWTLYAEAAPQYECHTAGCSVNAALTAGPAPLCDGFATTLSGAGSTFQGSACGPALEYRFEKAGELLRDWATDPYHNEAPTATTTYTVYARDPLTLVQDSAEYTVDVVPLPSTSVVQAPAPACSESAAISLDAGDGFAFYFWFDADDTFIGQSRLLPLDESACGQIYRVQAFDEFDCPAEAEHVVACQPCAPAEVSPAAAPVPFRMGIDAAGTVEFGLLPDPDVIYHLYGAPDRAAIDAGDWSHKICDLQANAAGTWSPVDATTVRWTPDDPASIPPALWVVVAERVPVQIEGPYGSETGGGPRPADLDGAGSSSNLGCP